MKNIVLLLCISLLMAKAEAQYVDSVYVGDKLDYFVDFGSGGATYTWATTGGKIEQSDPHDTKIKVTWCDKPGIYPLTVIETSPGLCSGDTTKMLVRVREPQGLPTADIPNVFTPNGDGNNDYFVIKGTNYNSFSLQIFNRWGQNIFESKSDEDRWDGKHKGTDCLPAYYYYILILQNKVGNKTYKGFVALEK